MESKTVVSRYDTEYDRVVLTFAKGDYFLLHELNVS